MMSQLHHKRIAMVLLFHSEFNKFTDRMLEKGVFRAQIIKDRRWGSAVAFFTGAAIRVHYITSRSTQTHYRHH
jgi:hypothetical protein